MTARYDVVIVGGGSAGCALANRLSADPSTTVLVLEAGRPDYKWDVFIHMPAGLATPIGNRLYDWKYESEPEPFMNGRRIYHARGKVLGGSSSINGMIFQRGNPLDYERWGADPGMGSWDYAHCLPYFKRMESCLAGADEFRGGDGPLVLERGPATSPLFEAFFEAVQQAGYPLTDDVNGFKQEGFAAFDRNIHDGRRLSAARAYLHPVMHRPNLDVRCRAFVNRVLFDGDPGGRGRGGGADRPGADRGRRGDPLRRRDQLAAAAPALRRRQRGASSRRSGSTSSTTCRGSASTCRTTSRSTSSTAPSSRSRSRPAMKWRNRPWVGFKWLFFRSGPGATNHFEAGGFIRGDDDVAYPNLMFHFLPVAIRYDGSSPAGGHGYQVHVGPMYSDARGSVKITSKDPRVHPALRFNYLSTEQDRREWLEAVHAARTILTQPAFEPFNAGELSPGSVGRDRRGDPRLGRARRGDRAAPVVHVPARRRRDVGARPGDDARARPRRAPRRRRVGLPVRHEREHLRADDDGGREGGRPDPRRHAAAGREHALLPASRSRAPEAGTMSP